ncbi:MAG: hypothetical protein ACXW2A_18050 [Burkholderiales bacterium]
MSRTQSRGRSRRSTMRITCCATAAFLGSLAVGTPVSAQGRFVVVNGQRLNDTQVAHLERRACTPIPNGRYWLDPQTGAWGYAENPSVQGVLGEACGRGQQSKSLSERRQLYRPGEILSR